MIHAGWTALACAATGYMGWHTAQGWRHNVPLRFVVFNAIFTAFNGLIAAIGLSVYFA